MAEATLGSPDDDDDGYKYDDIVNELCDQNEAWKAERKMNHLHSRSQWPPFSMFFFLLLPYLAASAAAFSMKLPFSFFMPQVSHCVAALTFQVLYCHT